MGVFLAGPFNSWRLITSELFRVRKRLLWSACLADHAAKSSNLHSNHDCWINDYNHFYPLTAKLFILNFHPLEVVSRWRDPQLQVSENYSDLTKWKSILFKSCLSMSHFILNIFKMWYLMCWYKMKTRIYAAPEVKGLRMLINNYIINEDVLVELTTSMIFFRKTVWLSLLSPSYFHTAWF